MHFIYFLIQRFVDPMFFAVCSSCNCFLWNLDEHTPRRLQEVSYYPNYGSWRRNPSYVSFRNTILLTIRYSQP